jgi:hypothetical protein
MVINEGDVTDESKKQQNVLVSKSFHVETLKGLP